MFKFENTDKNLYTVKIIFTDGKEHLFKDVEKTDFSNGFVMFDFKNCYHFINTSLIHDLIMTRESET